MRAVQRSQILDGAHYERTRAFSRAVGHGDQAKAPGPRRPVPDLPVREHDDDLVPGPGDAPRRADRTRGRHPARAGHVQRAAGRQRAARLLPADRDRRPGRCATAACASGARCPPTSTCAARAARRCGRPSTRTRSTSDRISAVQYLKFHLDDWRPVAVGCDLPGLIAETTLNREQRDALNDDLRSTVPLRRRAGCWGWRSTCWGDPSGPPRQSPPSAPIKRRPTGTARPARSLRCRRAEATRDHTISSQVRPRHRQPHRPARSRAARREISGDGALRAAGRGGGPFRLHDGGSPERSASGNVVVAVAGRALQTLGDDWAVVCAGGAAFHQFVCASASIRRHSSSISGRPR